MSEITRLGMPKWGLSMTEGKVIDWLVGEGAMVEAGDELVEVESEKINGAVESPAVGVLRRHVAAEGTVVPVGGLLGVIAPASVAESEIDAFVEQFQASFVPPEAAEEAEPPTLMVEVGGRRIRYLRRGEGDETLVLVHGFGGDLNNWLFNFDRMAEGRTALALDLPGHGESAKDVGAGDLGFFAGVLEGFLDALDLSDPVHLVGHSMGGAVILGLALAAPERVASLALVAGAGLGDEINPTFIDGFVNASKRRELKGVLQLLFADPDLVTRQMIDEVLRYKRLDGVEAALRTVAEVWFPGGRQSIVLRDRLGELRVPVLGVWGRQDQIVPAAHAEALRGRARIELLEGQGHSPHMEAANAFNRLLSDFLSGTR